MASKQLSKRSALYKAKCKIEKAKAQVRAKVEHPFRVIKRQFGYEKVRFRGLAKNSLRSRICEWRGANYWPRQEVRLQYGRYSFFLS